MIGCDDFFTFPSCGNASFTAESLSGIYSLRGAQSQFTVSSANGHLHTGFVAGQQQPLRIALDDERRMLALNRILPHLPVSLQGPALFVHKKDCLW